MYGQHPWYRGYPSNVSYNPYLHSSYQSPRSDYQYGYDENRARTLAEQRARKAQYLPDEVDNDDDDDWGYNRFGPRERAYLEARRRQEMLERKRQEEEAARQRALEEQKWQKALEERQREDQEVRQKLLDGRRRQLRMKKEEEARRVAAEREKVDSDLLLPDITVADPGIQLSQQQQQEMHTQRDRSRSNASERQSRSHARQESPNSQQRQGEHGQRDRSRSNAQERQPHSPGHQEATSIPIHIHQDLQSSTHVPSSPLKTSIPAAEMETSTTRPEGSSRPTTPRTPPARSPSPISKHSIEEQNEAASRIQKRYRIHASLQSLDNLATQFETLKRNFVYPRTIDFQKPGSEGGHISVGAYRPPSDFDNEDDVQPMDVDGSEGKLDYTSTNYALNSYMDSLDKLLMKLDGVESWGQKEIRLKRRSVVKSIEKEASKVDRYWKQTWVDYLVKQAAAASESKERANIPITSQSQPPSVSEDQPMQETED
ncbi:hypothetical protein CVT25_013114 [Psilocybe cyanescens]|uniref:BAG domain-containing protein n=1 Tax=Psilocybe cyanescens TaxID=93625 RepID=A0A409XHQ8_PSICY|nr:hypothetical protein CVT25_013114 [Psilocybe cyanescens]